MGWLVLAALGGGSLLLLWRVGVLDRGLLTAIGAALALAGAGYAWQGRPGLPGAAPQPRSDRPAGDSAFALERGAMFGRFSSAQPWLIFSDALLRMGASEAAVSALRSAIRENPRDPELWIGLANALTAHGDGLVSPAARLAYERAAALDPASPAPDWFLGLALAQSGDTAGARRVWERLLARSPPDAPWVPGLRQRLAVLAILERSRR